MYKHVSCWNGFILHIERVQWLLVHARTGPRLIHWTIHTYAYMALTSSVVTALTSSMVTMMYKAIHTSSYIAVTVLLTVGADIGGFMLTRMVIQTPIIGLD